MKTLVELFFYAVVSGLIGLVVCGVLAYRKRTRAAWICAAIFFGGPILAFAAAYTRDTLAQKDFEAARKEVQELCAKNGGDKIYRTVENVEGVFQMRARNPDLEGQMQDQYGMIDPWGAAQGDFMNIPVPLSTRGRGYLFVEQQPGFGQPEGPPYRRTYLKPTGRKNGDKYPGADYKDDPELNPQEIRVQKLRSRYGYLMEDLTTPEMRSKWIAGGRIKVIDLQTKEVLADRTGYFRAAGPSDKLKWAGSGAYSTDHMCPNHSHLGQFLVSVLKPISIYSLEQLKSVETE